ERQCAEEQTEGWFGALYDRLGFGEPLACCSWYVRATTSVSIAGSLPCPCGRQSRLAPTGTRPDRRARRRCQ
ncbi:MAG: hypothetical protein ACPIOQ_73225, partial [Promethearchaeia archaeon]